MQSVGKIQVFHKRAKVPADAIVVDCTSRSKEAWSRKFSPFYLGPIDVEPYDEKLKSETMENAWQFTKIFPGYEDKASIWSGRRKGLTHTKQ